MIKSFGFEQKEKAKNSSIFLPFVQNNIEPAVESKGETAVFSVAASATVPVVIPVADSAVVPAAVPAAVSAVVPAVVPAAATSTVPVAISDTEKSGSLSVASIESIIDKNSPETATSSYTVSTNSRYAAHKRKVFSDDSNHGRSVSVVLRNSNAPAHPKSADPRTASLPSSSRIPSFCATKKKKNSKVPMKIKLDISRYAAVWNPRSANSSTSSSSATMPIAPSDQRNQNNLSAAIACSSFTPYEYSKKVKSLELLTGKRDLSVSPFCKVLVTGIIPQPIRMVKKALIELTIRVEMVGKISFVGNTTEFLVLKAYKDKFCFKIGSNPFITFLYS
ncbi:hypothetical protein AYI69_g3815 [Smittium culicis]|uniref:Uncharacterized protein n=1 Tax=Smittium culicis TaxID=133412 RepID=A0A1R1YIP1_9FUNG|nr:hypothetical protein AYI69_g3815 [Smittium culicis]